MNLQVPLVNVSFNIPRDILEALAKLVFKPSKRMHLRKYSDVVFLKLLIIFHFLHPKSIRELHEMIRTKKVSFDEELPSIQTISYRMKMLDKEKIAELMKKLIWSFVAVDSTKMKEGERLHLIIDLRREEVVDFEISGEREVEVAERLMKGVRGKVVADRGYAEAEFMRKVDGYIRPRGKAGREFTKRPLMGAIYEQRWGIERFIQRLKMEINFERKKWRDVKRWIEWMLEGRMLAYIMSRVMEEPRTLEILLQHLLSTVRPRLSR